MLPRMPAPTAAGPRGPAMTGSTIPIAIQPTSASASGTARRSMGRNSRRKAAACSIGRLGFRVGLVVGGHQVGERDLRIFLRGGKARVAKQLLNGAQIRAGGEQMGGVGVA